ncbi:nucleotidyltransferase family protein [Lactococcus lactis]
MSKRWNYSDGNNLMTGIHDIDIVYFDKEISADSSAKNDKKLEKILSEKFPYQFDIHNEAYMHLWHNGNKAPYKNTENAMALDCYGSCCRHKCNSRNIEIFAPYGLEDFLLKQFGQFIMSIIIEYFMKIRLLGGKKDLVI